MKLLIILNSLLFLSFNFSLEVEDEILWNENVKLKITDFQGDIDTLNNNLAKTYSKIDFIYVEQDGILTIDFSCYFIKNKSWSKEKSNELLDHEQIHFDIAELVARNIRKECIALTTDSYDLDQALLYINEIYDRNYDSVWDELTNNYDKETNHGKNGKKQLIWKDKINLELNKLKSFSEPLVIKSIKK